MTIEQLESYRAVRAEPKCRFFVQFAICKTDGVYTSATKF